MHLGFRLMLTRAFGRLFTEVAAEAECVNIEIIQMVYFVIIKMTERQQFIKGAHKKCHLIF